MRISMQEYHTVLTLVRQWLGQNNCSATTPQHKMRHNVKSGSNLSLLRQQHEARRRQQYEQRRLKQCLRDAFNYTVDKESFQSRLRSSSHNMRSWQRTKDETLNSDEEGRMLPRQRFGRDSDESDGDELDEDDGEEGKTNCLLCLGPFLIINSRR